MDKDILNALDDFVPAPEEGFLGNKDEDVSYPIKNYKNLYLYVNRDQLFSILESLALKLSRTERTNDTTENIFAGENQVHAEVREYGYVCLTSTIISPMMWGQYADRGKGACLVFSGNFKKYTNSIVMTEYLDRRVGKGKSASISIYQVQYKSDRVTEKSDIKKAMSTKSKCWEHEKEYRIIVPLNNSTPIEDTKTKDSSKFFSYTYFYRKIMPSLSRIVLGVNNDLDVVDFQRKVNSACLYSKKEGNISTLKQNSITGKFPVIVTKATMDDNKFEINPNLSDLPPISRVCMGL